MLGDDALSEREKTKKMPKKRLIKNSSETGGLCQILAFIGIC